MYLALVQHLRFFNHTPEELWFGWLALGIQAVLILLVLWKPELTENAFFLLVRLAPPIMLLLAGVWTIDWKSTRLWLIIVLYLGTPILSFGHILQDTGNLNNASPFGNDYQIAQVLYPEGSTVPEYTKIRKSPIISASTAKRISHMIVACLKFSLKDLKKDFTI